MPLYRLQIFASEILDLTPETQPVFGPGTQVTSQGSHDLKNVVYMVPVCTWHTRGYHRPSSIINQVPATYLCRLQRQEHTKTAEWNKYTAQNSSRAAISGWKHARPFHQKESTVRLACVLPSFAIVILIKTSSTSVTLNKSTWDQMISQKGACYTRMRT